MGLHEDPHTRVLLHSYSGTHSFVQERQLSGVLFFGHAASHVGSFPPFQEDSPCLKFLHPTIPRSIRTALRLSLTIRRRRSRSPRTPTDPTTTSKKRSLRAIRSLRIPIRRRTTRIQQTSDLRVSTPLVFYVHEFEMKEYPR